MQLQTARNLQYLHLTFNFFKGDAKTGINGVFCMITMFLILNLYLLIDCCVNRVQFPPPRLQSGIFLVSTFVAMLLRYALDHKTRTMQLFVYEDKITVVYKYGPKEKPVMIHRRREDVSDIVWLEKEEWVILSFNQNLPPIFLNYKGQPDGKAYMYLLNQFLFNGKAKEDVKALQSQAMFPRANKMREWPPLENWASSYWRLCQRTIGYICLNLLIVYLVNEYAWK